MAATERLGRGSRRPGAGLWWVPAFARSVIDLANGGPPHVVGRGAAADRKLLVDNYSAVRRVSASRTAQVGSRVVTTDPRNPPTPSR